MKLMTFEYTIQSKAVDSEKQGCQRHTLRYTRAYSNTFWGHATDFYSLWVL